MSTRTTVRYEDDFYGWSLEQAGALRRTAAARVNLPEAIDFLNVAEEIESLGASQLRELYSRYRVLLLHLLKWQYQPRRRSRSWQSTILTERDDLAKLLRQSPGLEPKRKAELAEAYAAARTVAAIETGLPVERFPESCPYTLEEVESGAWLPGENMKTDSLPGGDDHA
jgi:transposase